MKKIFANIHQSITKPAPVETLGLFRIAIATFALIQLMVLLPDWMWFYGPTGLLPWQISDALSTTNTPSILMMADVLKHVHISANATVYIITSTYFISLIGLLIGYKTKLMAVLAWLMHIILNTTGHFTAYGVETFLHIALFYCVVLPVNCYLSIDNKRKPNQLPSYLITLSVRLIQLHLCIMYLACGIEKSMGEQWWNGEAIWMALQQDQFHRVDSGWMSQMPVIPKLLGWGTLLVETFYPIGIYNRRTRKFWLIGIISMHAFIAVFLGLQLFGGLMILFNFSMFGKECFPSLLTYKLPTVNTFIYTRKRWMKQPVHA